MSRTQNKNPDSEGRQSESHAASLRTNKRRRWWVGVAVVVLGLIAALMLTRPTPENAAVAEGQASPGESAPNIEMVDFSGEQVTLSEYRGTPVILNFWASWCPFCIAEMPDFQRVSQATAGQVVFIGVNLQDDQGLAKQLAEETGVTYRLTRDPQGVVYAAFGGIGMPTTVFVDASGIVRGVVTGQMSENQLRSAIAEHFAIDT